MDRMTSFRLPETLSARRRVVCLLLFCVLFALKGAAGCARPSAERDEAGASLSGQEEQPELTAATSDEPVVRDLPEPEEVELKNIILLIGDGMGPQQVGLIDLYARFAGDEQRYPSAQSHISHFFDEALLSLSQVTPSDGLVIDSGASATQLAAGVATPFGTVGCDAMGNAVVTVLDEARERGVRTGLVSETRLTHATPASFAASVEDRWNESSIAEQMIASGADIMLSAGARFFVPQGATGAADLSEEVGARFADAWPLESSRRDGRDLLEEARSAGYELVFTREQLLAQPSTERLLGLFGARNFDDGRAWYDDEDADYQPSLREMTEVALQQLERSPRGFFLMVEGGQIDWAGHANDAQRLLYELMRFDEAVEVVMRWADERDDTLVVLTADHETGGFSLHYTADGPPPFEMLNDIDAFPEFVRWSTSAHTHTPVFVGALGHAESAAGFRGYRTHVELGRRLMELVDSLGGEEE